MTQHQISLIGGIDDEIATFTEEEANGLCRLVCEYRGKRVSAEAHDYFEALPNVRSELEMEGLIPFCYGASLNVFPSGMARDMGRGKATACSEMAMSNDRTKERQMKKVCVGLAMCLCSSTVTAAEFSTPEEALAYLRAAVREKDAEKAVRAMDFNKLAEIRLEAEGQNDAGKERIEKEAQALEDSFRAKILAAGSHRATVSCKTPRKEKHLPGVYIVLEVCELPEGDLIKEWILLSKFSAGWRALQAKIQ